LWTCFERRTIKSAARSETVRKSPFRYCCAHSWGKKGRKSGQSSRACGAETGRAFCVLRPEWATQRLLTDAVHPSGGHPFRGARTPFSLTRGQKNWSWSASRGSNGQPCVKHHQACLSSLFLLLGADGPPTELERGK